MIVDITYERALRLVMFDERPTLDIKDVRAAERASPLVYRYAATGDDAGSRTLYPPSLARRLSSPPEIERRRELAGELLARAGATITERWPADRIWLAGANVSGHVSSFDFRVCGGDLRCENASSTLPDGLLDGLLEAAERIPENHRKVWRTDIRDDGPHQPWSRARARFLLSLLDIGLTPNALWCLPQWDQQWWYREIGFPVPLRCWGVSTCERKLDGVEEAGRPCSGTEDSPGECAVFRRAVEGSGGLLTIGRQGDGTTQICDRSGRVVSIAEAENMLHADLEKLKAEIRTQSAHAELPPSPQPETRTGTGISWVESPLLAPPPRAHPALIKDAAFPRFPIRIVKERGQWIELDDTSVLKRAHQTLTDTYRARKVALFEAVHGKPPLTDLVSDAIFEEAIAKLAERVEPIPMRLHCPACHELHLDEGAFAHKPHHTHACQACGNVWRPAKVATVGVRFLPGFKDEP